MPERVTVLRTRLAELTDLQHAAALLEWDRQTMMPPRGGAARAESLATLSRIRHEMFVSEETGRLLKSAQDEVDGADSDDARIVRVARRRYDKAVRVPSDLAADLARAHSLGQEAWIQARRDSDFAAFAPYLERNIELTRRYIDCFDSFACAYDVLLDDFEPQITTAEVARLFDELKAALLPMIATLAAHTDRVDDSCLHGSFPVDRQRRLVADVVELMGFDPASWRIDDAVHPFATSFGSSDVRITSRWDERSLASGLYSAIHECGHGLYEAGIAPNLQRTPIGRTDSLGLHESQSRMWENMVGRGRAFSGVLAPMIGSVFGHSIEAETLYHAVNRVQPSYIRVEADEATYGLHVIIRFELEQELVEGRLDVRDLPDAWNDRYHRYLGLAVDDDANGVLQDVHWSAGLIGYFPTYALGNLIAGQLWDRVHVDVPDLEDRIAAGELGPLREWLREHVHRHGSKYSTRELLDRVVGEPIAVAPFVAYLRNKLSDVYGVGLASDQTENLGEDEVE